MTIQHQQLFSSIPSILLQENINNVDHLKEEEMCSLDQLVRGIKEITGYEFRNPVLLQQAFTHASQDRGDYSGEPNNFSYERLEYIGDAVLNLSIVQEHFTAYGNLTPRKLTKLRSANVDTEKLARVALKYELHKFLRHNIASLPTQISEFTCAIEDHPLHSWGLIDVPRVLADIVESLVGAIYLDSGSSMTATWDVVKNLLQPLITPETFRTHPVTKLNETCQKRGLKLNPIDIWEDTGVFEFIIEGIEIIGKAKYNEKRNIIAKNRAAHDAYLQLVERFCIYNVDGL